MTDKGRLTKLMMTKTIAIINKVPQRGWHFIVVSVLILNVENSRYPWLTVDFKLCG
ncbi:hypothetical protein TUM4261_24710 [Shewanella sp. c952]|nr:hypothetical protein TUM4261_24710 [Shewanella sp. c952]